MKAEITEIDLWDNFVVFKIDGESKFHRIKFNGDLDQGVEYAVREYLKYLIKSKSLIGKQIEVNNV